MPGNPHRGCSDHSGIGKAFVLGSQDNQVNGLILSLALPFTIEYINLSNLIPVEILSIHTMGAQEYRLIVRSRVPPSYSLRELNE